MAEHAESRAEFQLERMILFSDAVFAIAITLLIIEVKVPVLHGGDATDRELLRALGTLVPKFLGFLISFVLIAAFWRIHHRMFGLVVGYTPRLVTLNLLFLLTIVVMPFSTGILGEYSTPRTLHLKIPLIAYVTNICLTGLVNLALWRYIGRPENRLVDDSVDPEIIKAAKVRAALVPAIFALAVPVAFLSPVAARYVPLLIPMVIGIIRRRSRRRGEAAGDAA